MTPFERLSSRFPGIEERALDRLISDGNLYNTKSHTLRDGISKDEARGILLLAFKTARDCGLTLVLGRDEHELMHPKFGNITRK
jgi:hypothetical protein